MAKKSADCVELELFGPKVIEDDVDEEKGVVTTSAAEPSRFGATKVIIPSQKPTNADRMTMIDDRVGQTPATDTAALHALKLPAQPSSRSRHSSKTPSSRGSLYSLASASFKAKTKPKATSRAEVVTAAGGGGGGEQRLNNHSMPAGLPLTTATADMCCSEENFALTETANTPVNERGGGGGGTAAAAGDDGGGNKRRKRTESLDAEKHETTEMPTKSGFFASLCRWRNKKGVKPSVKKQSIVSRSSSLQPSTNASISGGMGAGGGGGGVSGVGSRFRASIFSILGKLGMGKNAGGGGGGSGQPSSSTTSFTRTPKNVFSCCGSSSPEYSRILSILYAIISYTHIIIRLVDAANGMLNLIF